MFFTEANGVTHNEGNSVVVFPVVSRSLYLSLLRVSLPAPDKAFASETNDLGPVEYQNMSFTSQEASSIKIIVSRMLRSL